MDINISQWKWLMTLWLTISSFILFLFISAVNANAQPITFQDGENKLSGEYLTPLHNQPAKAVLVFVHGDGAQTYDADGYYELIWDQLRAQGYAVLSWDKPGVGDSLGNWLDQTMQDRQQEVMAAVEWVQQNHGFTASNTGLIGFSQAGWVVPALASNDNKVGFAIGVGFAKNWIEQGRYYTQTKHQLADDNKADIQAAIAQYNDEVNFFKSALPSDYKRNDSMSRQRFQFVIKNINADASAEYKKINIPTLLLWGKDDLNVDAKAEFAYWQQQPNPYVTTVLLDDANHGLLDSKQFSRQSYGIKDWLKLAWLGEDAMASDVMPTLLRWLEQLPLPEPIK
ncbi:alpha/beta hydrolase [Motilimonas cestriensis]|uniref:Alpha/beta hydrolase n=1 Tax=Motilimonas cestriensis TaxID=2742685 RepID=A0ABS8WDV6_9GAMM|nr:alpha/beta hydrolase [Motilimonas cestriensis]MCE2596453.1 alpha/beta hydrolase [Motilimonas cestriensis]